MMQGGRGDVADPDGQHAERDGEKDVESRAEPIAVGEQIERLQAEGGKSREAAKNADHDKLARDWMSEDRTFRRR